MKPDSLLPQPVHFGVTNGTAFAVYGAGQPLIFIHGVGMGKEVWAPQIAAFSSQYQVIVYDMLGHGDSKLPPEGVTLQMYAQQLVDLLDHLKIKAANIVGHSMGALIALEFAIRYPERTTRVAALNAVYSRTAEQRKAVMQRADALRDIGIAATIDSTMERWFGNPVPAARTDVAELVHTLLQSINTLGYARTYDLFASSDHIHVQSLPGLKAPALFMTGEFDLNSSPEMSAAMAQATPGAQLVIIPGERHMMSLTAPAEVNRQLSMFINTAIPSKNTTLHIASSKETNAMTASIDTMEFRKALGSFVTGVTVVATTQEDGTPRGFTANSFSSVSLAPPLVSVCIGKVASSYPVFSGTSHFSVSVLAENQKNVSGVFASKSPDKFEQVAWHKGTTGSPIMDGAAAWFDCETYQVIDAGDHIILLGQVVGFEASSASPLGYCRGGYLTFSLSQDAMAAATSARVGAILESHGGIVMLETPDHVFHLPTGTSLDPASDPTSLRGVFSKLKLDAQLDFLFAVFEDTGAKAGAVHVYYRGQAIGELPQDGAVRVVPLDAIPWDRLQDEAVSSMLRRYVKERSEDAFGVYVGDANTGSVQPLAKSV